MTSLIETTSFKSIENWSVAHILENIFEYNHAYKLRSIGDFLTRNKTVVTVEDSRTYKRVTIRLYNKGVHLRNTEIGSNIGTKRQFLVKKGQFLLSKIDARNGAFGIATNEVDNAIITADFFAYDINTDEIIPDFLVLLTTTSQFQKFAQGASTGTTGRQRINEQKFLNVKVPLPPISIQKKIVESYLYWSKLSKEKNLEADAKKLEIEDCLIRNLQIDDFISSDTKLLNFIAFKTVKSWSYRDNISPIILSSNAFPTKQLANSPELFEEIFRGKSPKYSSTSDAVILNQKCNRWNKLELQHTKSVDKDWLSSIDAKFLTKEGDILLNSTGDGTIGRATCITKDNEFLLYDSHILLLRLNKQYADPLFFTFFLNSKFGQLQIENIKSAVATKQTELGINNLKNIQFIVPNLKQQRKIAKEMAVLDKEVDMLKQTSQECKEKALIDFEMEIFNDSKKNNN